MLASVGIICMRYLCFTTIKWKQQRFQCFTVSLALFSGSICKLHTTERCTLCLTCSCTVHMSVIHIYNVTCVCVCLTCISAEYRGCRSWSRRTRVPRGTCHRNRPGQLISSWGAEAAKGTGWREPSGVHTGFTSSENNPMIRINNVFILDWFGFYCTDHLMYFE